MSRVALVTGAARGIGAATVRGLAAAGWSVLAVDRCADDPALPYPLGTRDELDRAAPKHPVLYHAGPAGVASSLALKMSGVTKDTPNPRNGVIVKDPTTGEPTGMLRSASP